MKIPLGAKVTITGSHPWQGESGEVISGETNILGTMKYRVRLKLDDAMDGPECFVLPSFLSMSEGNND